MGFRKPNLDPVYTGIRQSLGEIYSSYNDGFVQMSCKAELYQLKCWLEDEYERLPKFTEEKEWEQNRMIDILRKP